MKKKFLMVNIFSVFAVLILIIFLPFIMVSLPPAVNPVENLTVNSSDIFMLKEEKYYYPMKGMVVEVTNDTIPIGIAAQTYELNFGRIPLNSTSRKILKFNSTVPTKVEFYLSGNITPYIVIPKKLYVEGEEKLEITFNGTKVGNFTGTLLVRNIIPKNILAEKIIRMI